MAPKSKAKKAKLKLKISDKAHEGKLEVREEPAMFLDMGKVQELLERAVVAFEKYVSVFYRIEVEEKAKAAFPARSKEERENAYADIARHMSLDITQEREKELRKEVELMKDGAMIEFKTEDELTFISRLCYEGGHTLRVDAEKVKIANLMPEPPKEPESAKEW